MATETMNATAPSTQRAAATRPSPKGAPRVDIYETETSYVLLADMPGVATEGLEVVTERGTLAIRGRVTPTGADPDYQEFDLLDYERSFILSDDLDTEGITARLRDGVLRVEIPKSPGLRPKKIPVHAE